MFYISLQVAGSQILNIVAKGYAWAAIKIKAQAYATIFNSSSAPRHKKDNAQFYAAATINKKAIRPKNSILAYTNETTIKYLTTRFFQFNCLYL